MTDLQECADVGLAHQTPEQEDESDHANHAGNTADPVDHPITEHRHQHDDAGKNQDADAVTDVKQLTQRLTGKHGTRRGETQVHQAHQHDRDCRAVNAKLHATGDHLRQTQFRPLRSVQRHHPAAEQLADQQTDQRPEHITAKDHGQCAGDNRGDLQVGTHPQGELAKQTTVSFRFRDVVDRTLFDQRFVACTIGVNSHDSTSVDCSGFCSFLAFAFVGVSLLAIAVCQSAHLPTVPASSRAGSLLQGLCVYLPVIIGRFRPCSLAQSMAIW
ncbi:hypothetical protein D3C87_1286500 [compost metagenome]